MSDLKAWFKRLTYEKPLSQYTEAQLLKKKKDMEIVGCCLIIGFGLLTVVVLFGVLPFFKEASVIVETQHLTGLDAINVLGPSLAFIVAPVSLFSILVWSFPGNSNIKLELRLRELKRELANQHVPA